MGIDGNLPMIDGGEFNLYSQIFASMDQSRRGTASTAKKVSSFDFFHN